MCTETKRGNFSLSELGGIITPCTAPSLFFFYLRVNLVEGYDVSPFMYFGRGLIPLSSTCSVALFHFNTRKTSLMNAIRACSHNVHIV